MNEPQPGQRFDLEASLEDMVENPKGEFALAADLDAALDLLRRWRGWYDSHGLEGDLVALGRDTGALLDQIGEAA